MSSKGSLNNRFKGFGAAPSPGAWQNIAAALPQEQKRKAIIWWVASGAGIAASILIAAFVISSKSNNSNIAESTIQIENKEQYDHHTEKVITKNESNGLSNNSNESNYDKMEKRDLPTEKSNQTVNLQESQNKKVKPAHKLPKDNHNKAINGSISNHHHAKVKNDMAAILPHKKEKIKAANQPIDPIVKLLPREAVLLAVNDSKRELERKKILDISPSALSWGGGLNSNMGLQNLTPKYSTIGTYSNEYDLSTNNAESNLPPFLFLQKINRPIIGNLFLRLNLTQRLFLESEINGSWLRARHNNISNTSLLNSPITTSNKTSFFTIGSAFRFGYQFIKRKRWAFDVSTGLLGEKAFRKAPYIKKDDPLFLWGNSTELGINFHLSEKLTLRLAPRYNWVFGQTENQFYAQFQKQKNLGLGLKLLKSF